MAFSRGSPSVCIQDILKITTEADIASRYLGIHSIPCVINSPLREDNHPSLGIYSPNGIEVNYIDFSINERGRIYTLLSKLWNISYEDTLKRILKEFSNNTKYNTQIRKTTNIRKINSNDIRLECCIRDWRDYDIAYWTSYGISLEWLKYAEVYPISHKLIYKNGEKFVFGADKYAYAYVERKEGKVTLKIYQPFNKRGFKWCNKHDKSVISLWTKIPEYGDKVCICSSLKDALCLWANTGIPAIAIQGEGYPISNTAISELRRRYKEIYILLDNDEAGLEDGLSLSASTGFTNLVLPKFKGGKDISDLYRVKGKEAFLQIISSLFNN